MAQFDAAELAKLSKDELVEENDRLGLPTKGTKQALVQQLVNYEEPAASDDDELDDDEDEVDDEIDDESEADDEEIDDEAEAQAAADAKAKAQADARDIKAVAARESDDEDDDLELDDEEVDVPAEPVKKTRAKRTKAQVKAVNDDAAGDGTVPAKAVASMLGVEAKTLRQFFRSSASRVQPVGAGGRYEFAEADIDQIKADFAKWRGEHAARGQRRTGDAAKKGKRTKPEVTEIEDAKELDIDELDDEIDEGELELEDED